MVATPIESRDMQSFLEGSSNPIERFLGTIGDSNKRESFLSPDKVHHLAEQVFLRNEKLSHNESENLKFAYSTICAEAKSFIQEQQVKANDPESRNRLFTFLESNIVEIVAISCEMMRRETGVMPYKLQIIEAITMIFGAVAEIKTGEGKAVLLPLVALAHGVFGRDVWIATTNDMLAERDQERFQPLFQALNRSNIKYSSLGSLAHQMLRSEYRRKGVDLFSIVADELDALLLESLNTSYIIAGEKLAFQDKKNIVKVIQETIAVCRQEEGGQANLFLLNKNFHKGDFQDDQEQPDDEHLYLQDSGKDILVEKLVLIQGMHNALASLLRQESAAYSVKSYRKQRKNRETFQVLFPMTVEKLVRELDFSHPSQLFDFFLQLSEEPLFMNSPISEPIRLFLQTISRYNVAIQTTLNAYILKENKAYMRTDMEIIPLDETGRPRLEVNFEFLQELALRVKHDMSYVLVDERPQINEINALNMLKKPVLFTGTTGTVKGLEQFLLDEYHVFSRSFLRRMMLLPAQYPQHFMFDENRNRLLFTMNDTTEPTVCFALPKDNPKEYFLQNSEAKKKRILEIIQTQSSFSDGSRRPIIFICSTDELQMLEELKKDNPNVFLNSTVQVVNSRTIVQKLERERYTQATNPDFITMGTPVMGRGVDLVRAFPTNCMSLLSKMRLYCQETLQLDVIENELPPHVIFQLARDVFTNDEHFLEMQSWFGQTQELLNTNGALLVMLDLPQSRRDFEQILGRVFRNGMPAEWMYLLSVQSDELSSYKNRAYSNALESENFASLWSMIERDWDAHADEEVQQMRSLLEMTKPQEIVRRRLYTLSREVWENKTNKRLNEAEIAEMIHAMFIGSPEDRLLLFHVLKTEDEFKGQLLYRFFLKKIKEYSAENTAQQQEYMTASIEQIKYILRLHVDQIYSHLVEKAKNDARTPTGLNSKSAITESLLQIPWMKYIFTFSTHKPILSSLSEEEKVQTHLHNLEKFQEEMKRWLTAVFSELDKFANTTPEKNLSFFQMKDDFSAIVWRSTVDFIRNRCDELSNNKILPDMKDTLSFSFDALILEDQAATSVLLAFLHVLEKSGNSIFPKEEIERELKGTTDTLRYTVPEDIGDALQERQLEKIVTTLSSMLVELDHTVRSRTSNPVGTAGYVGATLPHLQLADAYRDVIEQIVRSSEYAQLLALTHP